MQVGDRVECQCGRWTFGTVVQLFYIQSSFPSNQCAPYQIKLDDGRLVFAPSDEDRVIRIATTPLEALPPELISCVVQHLSRCDVSELTRLREVSTGWRVRADEDDEAWTCHLHDFDPLQIIGRPGLQILRDELGTWAAVAQELATRSEFSIEPCGSCANHPDATPVRFVLPSRWIFRPPESTLCGNGSVGSGKMLRRLVNAMQDYETMCLSGVFLFTKPLTLKKNIRLVGKDGEGATIRLYACGIRVQAAVVLKDLNIHATHNQDLISAHQKEGACLGAGCPECRDHLFALMPGTRAHAIVVSAPEGDARSPAHGLIAEDLDVSSTVGTAVLIKGGARASLTRCALSYVEQSSGEQRFSAVSFSFDQSTLSTAGCTLSHAVLEPCSDGWNLVGKGSQELGDMNTTTLPGQGTGHRSVAAGSSAPV